MCLLILSNGYLEPESTPSFFNLRDLSTNRDISTLLTDVLSLPVVASVNHNQISCRGIVAKIRTLFVILAFYDAGKDARAHGRITFPTVRDTSLRQGLGSACLRASQAQPECRKLP